MSFLKILERGIFMQKKYMTITLSEATQKNLEELREKYGLTKSQAIAYAINTVVLRQEGATSGAK